MLLVAGYGIQLRAERRLSFCNRTMQMQLTAHSPIRVSAGLPRIWLTRCKESNLTLPGRNRHSYCFRLRVRNVAASYPYPDEAAFAYHRDNLEARCA